MSNLMLKAALFYKNKLNFSIIPIKDDKTPFIKWTPFQNEIARDCQIKWWWEEWPDANVGIVTGKISNIVVVDIDSIEGFRAVNKYLYLYDNTTMPKVRTPSGGTHVYYKYPFNGIRNNSRIIPDCDLRADGGYVLAPPSTGYNWIEKGLLKQFIKALIELPESYLKKIKTAVAENTAFDRELFQDGTRDDDLYHTAICLLKGGMSRDNVYQIVEVLSQNCNPPFPLEEARMKIKSALNRCRR